MSVGHAFRLIEFYLNDKYVNNTAFLFIICQIHTNWVKISQRSKTFKKNGWKDQIIKSHSYLCKKFTTFLPAVCTFLFDERVGSFSKPPNQRAEDFVKNLLGFFHEMQALLFSMPIYKAISTPSWKKFEHHSDNLHKLGLHFVHKVRPVHVCPSEGLIYHIPRLYLWILLDLFPEYNWNWIGQVIR